MSGKDECKNPMKSKSIYDRIEERKEEAREVMMNIGHLTNLYMKMRKVSSLSKLDRTFVIGSFKIKHSWMKDYWTISYKTGRFTYKKVLAAKMVPVGQVIRIDLYLPEGTWTHEIIPTMNRYQEEAERIFFARNQKEAEKLQRKQLKEDVKLMKQFGLD